MDLILQSHCHIIVLNKLYDLWSLNRRQSNATSTDISFYMVSEVLSSEICRMDGQNTLK